MAAHILTAAYVPLSGSTLTGCISTKTSSLPEDGNSPGSRSYVPNAAEGSNECHIRHHRRQIRVEAYRQATPVEVAACRLPHKRERTFIAAVRGGSSWLGNCATAPAQQAVEPSFPTPTVMDMGWGRSRDEWSTWIDNQRAKHRNGNGHGRSLYQLCGEGTLLVMEHLMGLPTGYITNQGLSVGAQRKLLGNGVAPAQGALGLYRALQQF